MASPAGKCSNDAVALKERIEGIFEVKLPECPDISVTKDGGIVAKSEDEKGSIYEIRITEKGVFESNYCSVEGLYSTPSRRIPGAKKSLFGPACANFKNFKLRGPIDESRIAEAKELILGGKKLAKK